MKKTSIGGSALIEGLMMIGPENAAIAVRKPDGEIVVEKRGLPIKDALTKIWVVRGMVNFFRQMILVYKAMMFSASFLDLEEDEEDMNEAESGADSDAEKETERQEQQAELQETKAQQEELQQAELQSAVIETQELSEQQGEQQDKPDESGKEKATEWVIYIAVVLSILFSVGLFTLLPNLITSAANDWFFGAKRGHFSLNLIALNLFEGAVRIGIFLLYLAIASMLNDVKRVWQYHGAEHKTIHCYENNEELTVENIKKYSTRHPRCGTSFMLIVMVMSIIIFSFSGWWNVWLNILIRVVMIPIIAGLSYEVLRWAGRSDNKAVNLLNKPGEWFQAFTTKEPDSEMIEVAIAAMENVLVEDENADNW